MCRVFDRDEIYRAEYDGWYDVSSETFITDKELETLVGEATMIRRRRYQLSTVFRKQTISLEWANITTAHRAY